MITNVGKNIITKYLIGQAPSYASYIAVGCGAVPLLPADDLGDYGTKKNLDFEMFRVPVTSRGYINEPITSTISTFNDAYPTSGKVRFTTTAAHGFTAGQIVTISGISPSNFNIANAEIVATPTGTTFEIESTETGTYTSGGIATVYVPKIVLTGQLPAEERYEITELGLYSAESNPSAIGFDSRTLYSFNTNEAWEYHKSDDTKVLIPKINTRLNSGLAEIDVDTDGIVGYDTDDKAFMANADNVTFNEELRQNRLERPRFYNNTIIVRGDMSDLEMVDGHLVVNNPSDHIHNNNITIDLSRSSAIDEIRVAFYVINKAADSSVPDAVRLLVEFSNEDTANAASPDKYTRVEVQVNHSTTPSAGEQDFTENRYFVVNVPLKDLYSAGTGFSWTAVNSVRIFATVEDGGVPSDQYYVGLDAIRIENVASVNSLYGLTGYTVMKNDDALTHTNPRPIAKEANTSNFVEFRFVADVK
jgi:hypothetical protein